MTFCFISILTIDFYSKKLNKIISAYNNINKFVSRTYSPSRMIIPIKCFTCGQVLADKYRYFQAEVRAVKLAKGLNVEKVVYLTKNNVEKTPEGNVLDDLGLTNVCCRRHMLTHVDVE